MKRDRVLAVTILLAAMILLTTAAAADILVMRDGSQIETKGPWKVKGRQVVFTRLRGGTLSSMRLEEVDLEASEEATKRAAEPPPAAADEDDDAPPPEPVLELTNKDIRRAAVGGTAASGGAAAEGGTEGGQETAAAAASSSGVRAVDTSRVITNERIELVRWEERHRPESQSFEVYGILRNVAKNEEASLEVIVTIFDLDEEGGEVEVARGQALVDTQILRGGMRAGFRASFSNILDKPTGQPRFEIRSFAR